MLFKTCIGTVSLVLRLFQLVIFKVIPLLLDFVMEYSKKCVCCQRTEVLLFDN